MVRKVQIVGVMSVAFNNRVADRSAEKYVIDRCFLVTVDEGVPRSFCYAGGRTLGAHAQRVTVVVSCVCVGLYVRTHAILAVRAIRSRTNDAIVLSVRFAAILKRRFSLNCLIRKSERFSLTSAGAAIFS